MSVAALQHRTEPGRLPAFIFAALVHAGFAAVLVFGVSWQTKAPIPLTAELWSTLPTVKVPEPAPPPDPEPAKVEPEPPPSPKPEPVKVEPPKPSKADIELKQKQEKEKKQKLEREAEEKKKREADDKKRKEEEKRKAEERVKKAQEAKARAEADAAAQAAASRQQKLLDDWVNQIRVLVRSKANVPDSVSGYPEVQIRLKLLVNGAVFEAVLVKPSGNRVYDESIQRAIAGIRPWPTPSDPDIFRNNREINLNIKHDK